MRRAFVIFLMFLFPLHVFAARLDCRTVAGMAQAFPVAGAQSGPYAGAQSGAGPDLRQVAHLPQLPQLALAGAPASERAPLFQTILLQEKPVPEKPLQENTTDDAGDGFWPGLALDSSALEASACADGDETSFGIDLGDTLIQAAWLRAAPAVLPLKPGNGPQAPVSPTLAVPKPPPDA
jgi:hypothetical protein